MHAGNTKSRTQFEASYENAIKQIMDIIEPDASTLFRDKFITAMTKTMATEENHQKFIEQYGENFNLSNILENITRIIASETPTETGIAGKTLWEHKSESKFRCSLRPDNSEVSTTVDCYFGEELSQIVIKCKQEGYWDVYPVPLDTLATLSLIILVKMENTDALLVILDQFVEFTTQSVANFYELEN